ncbi:MAG TPA: hypothetical protein VLV78_13425 [Thermoanaerobaculia bacterium]|nr:hypothetical protein [Thermoanaerobaculia bacterium]
MNAAFVHLALNNFPPILNLVGLCILVGSLSARSATATRIALIVLLSAALIGVPTYLSGQRAQAIVKKVESVNVPAIEPHQEAALAALVFLIIEAVFVVIALIRPRPGLTIAVLIVSILSTLTVLYAARLGGHIHHPETQIRNG